MIKLYTWILRTESGHRINLTRQGIYEFGTSEQADIRIRNINIHFRALLFISGDDVRLINCSINDILHNGRRVMSTIRLKPGDVLRFGWKIYIIDKIIPDYCIEIIDSEDEVPSPNLTPRSASPDHPPTPEP